MRVFITGGTGLIGSAVVAELRAHDHDVLALARSDRSAAAAAAMGAEVVRGGIGDLDAVRRGAAAADGAVHLAFGNDFSTAEAFQRNVTEETAAIDAIAAELTGRDAPFVLVSGTPIVSGRAALESDALPAVGLVAGRNATVTRILGMADRGLRASAVRMPRTVHRDGEGGFAGLLTDAARRSGVAAYPGDGAQRWPAVHAADAAVLFRLALEQATAGAAWHAVTDEGDAVAEIAAVIGDRLGLPVESRPEAEFGPLGPIFATDQPASSARTREALGWAPTHGSLLDDLRRHLR